MKLYLTNGSYSIDSICGLGYKLTAMSDDTYDVNSNGLEIDFTLPYENVVTLQLTDVLGNVVEADSYTLPAGTYSKRLHAPLYAKGLYYIVFKSGLFSKVVSVYLF
jgi:hypothetical protein